MLVEYLMLLSWSSTPNVDVFLSNDPDQTVLFSGERKKTVKRWDIKRHKIEL